MAAPTAKRSSLSAEAKPFYPSSFRSDGAPSLDSEEAISQEELDELEAAEEWVELQAGIEEAENQFLIELALELAPPTRVAEAEEAVLDAK